MFIIDTREQFKCLASELNLDPVDVKYVLRRIRSEGVAFLTKTMPQLGKSVLHSLELGYFERPTCFSWHSRSLRCFRSLLDKIFDHSTGFVLDSVDPIALYSIRTISEYFYKLALPFEEHEIENSTESFVKEDNALERNSFDWDFIETLRKDFETHHGYHYDTSVDVFKHQRPYLTPGTYSGKTQDVYYIHKTCPIQVPSEYKPIEGFFKPYPSAPLKMEIGSDTANHSEVLFVPKDSRGPRTIVREPMARLAAQMSFHVWLRDNLHRVSRGRVNFVNQQVNRELARTSSITREQSTLDLKSASDRVALCVIQHITTNSPAFRYFLKHRSQYAILPNGKLHKLKKIAGMGSGLTFPTMSLLIYLASVRAITNQKVSYNDAMAMVYVYGDDIVIPSRYTSHVHAALKAVGLEVNSTKSFKHSHFRESCGGDYYKGQDVGPLRLKLSNCENTVKNSNIFSSGSLALLQIERHARECVRHGFLALADYYYSLIERKYGSLPAVSGDSPILGRYSLVATPYPTSDEFGNAPKKNFLCAVPVKRYVGIMDPYVFLGSKFSQGLGVIDPLNYMDKTIGSAYGEIAVPRLMKYVRIEKSMVDLHV